MKAYITKYALTKGIQAVNARVCTGISLNMIAYRIGGSIWDQYAHGEGKDWHRTRAAAVKRANAMRDAKLKAIEKQAKRIRALEFK